MKRLCHDAASPRLEGAGRGRQVLIGRGIDFDEIEERLPGVEPD